MDIESTQPGKKRGNPNLHKFGNKFSATNQPDLKAARSRKKTLTDLLKKGLNERKEIIVEGEDIATGAKIKVKIPMPTDKVIIATLLRMAAKGNLKAIEMIFDRLEGKPELRVTTKGDAAEEADKEAQRYIILANGERIPLSS